jgi:hypothetical protein
VRGKLNIKSISKTSEMTITVADLLKNSANKLTQLKSARTVHPEGTITAKDAVEEADVQPASPR